MRLFSLIVLTAAILAFASGNVAAQSNNKMIILVRHAEKADATSPDPELSDAGKERARRLIRAIGKYRPGAFYSTDFIRTRDTIMPLAIKRGKTVQTYDAKKPQNLFDQIMKSDTERFVISGHSNSIPSLANLITKKNLFKNLDESEYTVIWLIKIKNGKVRKIELLDY